MNDLPPELPDVTIRNFFTAVRWGWDATLSSVPALAVKPVHKLIPKVWSDDGSKLSKYRRTMELTGERMSSRSSRVATPQVAHSFSSLEESFARFHPALMLPDPSLLSTARSLAGSLRAGSLRAPSRGSTLSRGTPRERTGRGSTTESMRCVEA